jgi:hypothetical protein
MQQHTMSDVKKADRLWDEMPLSDVSDKTGVPYNTLRNWSSKGLISTDTTHTGGDWKYSEEIVDRADTLYDYMPPSEIAEVLDVTYSVLEEWIWKGWISTDQDWSSHNGATKKADPARAAELVGAKGMTYQEAADVLGVSQSTAYKYVQEYQSSGNQ